ncbi:MAG: heme lyase CcmF/NrfE family subunit [Rickettsia endosymbiont of Ixodes persulcatus]|nr:heme lyase CcmF/NrfE family subunit [Rickettsia endosymbiont of Ixodes persulcatus]MCZ6910303.1 heme lyase CcmF/NrfE family subunit [Rickettsia endosymbiont of Ixodes persulcatus]MCZ6913408.1 heme lyase CcmF/NrfE family subunit [Rickettsia endosymbiont of Ixodes persulcatus]MCZ6919646.1 heme lyase CcmF/NrfE family subunit [Rickettsia endosymbiont of Ixodes persulcatus]MCZ6924459.1 heme lyase CcmF/NrfE family subunit [Rickettsia endosymbiont of Ixodes persulcatus]
MSEIGNFLLLATMCLSSVSVLSVIPWRDHGIQKKIKKDWIPRSSHGMTTILPFYMAALFTLFAFYTLVYAFIISDFSLQNVFLNSSTLKPLIYKIAGSWSSHEGSMLLWFSLLQIISCCYIFLLEDNQLKFLSIIILSALQLFFSSFIYFTSNPFNVFSFSPKEGLGLNPMLQDIALSIHPPLLYLGYVSYVVPFTIATVMLLTPVIPRLDRGIHIINFFLDTAIKSRYDINYSPLCLLKTFAGFGILFTTIGISLGSWWAYRELGWGGFWFFDPVENISLFPWLSGIMLYHSIIVTAKTGRMQSWMIILSIVTFLLVIFSTFLVRSAFVTSIHSFAFSPEIGIYLLGIFLILSIGSIGLYSVIPRLDREISGSLPSQTVLQDPVVKPRYDILGILLGNIFFLLSLIVLIAATLYPPIYSLFDDKPIIISETFFINNFIIFVIPILCTIGLFTTRSSIKKHIIILILSLIITYLISSKVTFSAISILTIIASIFLMLHNVHHLLIKTNYFRNRLKASNASMILGHFGFALISFSITMNALLQSEMDFTGEVGTNKTFNEFKVTLQNIKFAQGKNYYRQIAEFWLEDNSCNITILKPENRLYIVEKSLSQESDIYSYLSYDLYAVLSNIDGDIIHAKIYYKPMMSFIWLGIILTASGFFIALIRKNAS